MQRSDLFLVSKLWNTFHERERVGPICRRQLADWGIDYFDLYLIHFPIALKYIDPADAYPPKEFYPPGSKTVVPSKATIQETWTAMEGLVGAGLARSIGICNFNGQIILDMLRYAQIVPATLQVEIHPYLAQLGLTEFAQRSGMAVTAYWSFGPGSAQEMDKASVGEVPVLFEHEVVTGLARQYKKTPAQVLLRWAVQRQVCVIPKSNNPTRLVENLDLFSFNLKDDEIKEISALDRKMRFNDPCHVGVSRMKEEFR